MALVAGGEGRRETFHESSVTGVQVLVRGLGSSGGKGLRWKGERRATRARRTEKGRRVHGGRSAEKVRQREKQRYRVFEK